MLEQENNLWQIICFSQLFAALLWENYTFCFFLKSGFVMWLAFFHCCHKNCMPR